LSGEVKVRQRAGSQSVRGQERLQTEQRDRAVHRDKIRHGSIQRGRRWGSQGQSAM